MTSELDAMDRQRRRWRRARRAMRLDDLADPQFATGGLGDMVQPLTCRIVVLPSDPERHVIDFDDAFLKTWMSMSSPFDGRSLQWGNGKSTTASAGVRYDRAGDQWDRYAGLHHSGALDLGLGTTGGWRGEHRGWTGSTSLIPVVATVWEACHVYLQLAELYELALPWKLLVAIPQAKGTVLDHFGQGWAAPGEFRHETETCSEPALLIQREVITASAEWPRAAAFSVGTQLDNAFGSSSQRFRTFKNGLLGDFDLSRYR